MQLKTNDTVLFSPKQFLAVVVALYFTKLRKDLHVLELLYIRVIYYKSAKEC